MEFWKKNLWVCCFALFIASLGTSQMAPILPLYIEHLGIYKTEEIAKWSGIAFGSTFITLAIFSPIWGNFADKYGRKLMVLRASLWLSLIMVAMGFVNNVYQLIGLRILQGALSGFQSAAITLIATQTPKGQVGWALGIMYSAQLGGTLLGPLLGGCLSEVIGFRDNFIAIGILCFAAFIACLLLIREKPINVSRRPLKFMEVWHCLSQPKVTICLFITSLVIQFALISILPIITVYISQLSSKETTHIALISGAVFAASGLASILAAPKLGKISDKIGARKVLLVALVVAGILFFPQAFVKNSWQLGILRFLLGLAIAGLSPSINSILTKITPNAVTGRIYGYNQFAKFLGVFLGALFGGQLAAVFSIQYVFFFTCFLLILNALWVYQTIYKEKF